MADESFKRKLAAILSADVKGYSRLMEDNEEATVRAIKAYRAAINDLAQQYRGRIVDSPGDNILAEFNSVVDAVNCAVEIQCELANRNAELSENRKMEFRIGVNLGDVIEDDGYIYGDGVNIAARVESLAGPGDICISGRAYDQVSNKLGLEYENLGVHQVKNISVPIRVYRVLSYPGAAANRVVQAKKTLGLKGQKVFISAVVVVAVFVTIGIWQFYVRRPTVEPASIDKMAFPLPEKPSIAVLPFDNMSGDLAQDFFSDGITEDIITVLSKIGQLFVISRNSTFVYKNKPTSVKQIAEELGVRYVLEGSVRRSDDSVRISAQLIDAIKGTHLWAERYDRDLKELFALQDEITMKIVNALRIKLTEGEQIYVYKKYKNFDAWYKGLETYSYWRKGNKEDLIKVGQLAQEIIDIDPDSVFGYHWLAWYHWALSTYGVSPQENLKKAFELSQKVLSMDVNDAHSHGLIGFVYMQMRKFEKAIASGKRAVELAPNGALVHMLLGATLSYAGHVDQAIVYLKQARRLNPFPAYYHYVHMGRCYRQKGQYEDALAEYKKGLQLAPDSSVFHLSLAATYALLDQEEEARASAKRFLELTPNFSVTEFLKNSPFKKQDDTNIFADALRKAGFPE